MKLKVFCVYDDKAGTFAQPFYFPSPGMAVRAFEAAVNEGKGDIGKWPGDFKLFYIGEFDDQIGMFDSVTPQLLGVGVDFVQPERQVPLALKEVGS